MGRIAAVFKADGDETVQRYSISEWWLEARTQGPGAHAHDEDDVFFVIEGTMSFLLGGIDLVTILVAILALFLVSVWAGGLGLMLSSLSKSRVMSVFVFAAGAGVVVLGFVVVEALFSAVRRGLPVFGSFDSSDCTFLEPQGKSATVVRKKTAFSRTPGSGSERARARGVPWGGASTSIDRSRGQTT